MKDYVLLYSGNRITKGLLTRCFDPLMKRCWLRSCASCTVIYLRVTNLKRYQRTSMGNVLRDLLETHTLVVLDSSFEHHIVLLKSAKMDSVFRHPSRH